ncbi:MAG: NTP transferase domain-containing protein [Acidimicrobiales bacterium]
MEDHAYADLGPDRRLSALVIATGGGGPIRSERPKSIHVLCGQPMMGYVLDALGEVGIDSAVVITGPGGDRVRKRMAEHPTSYDVSFVEQRYDRGSADAALVGLSGFDDFVDDADLLVVPADMPLVDPAELRSLVAEHRASGAACTALTVPADLADPFVVARDRHGRVSGLEPQAVAVGRDDLEAVVGVYCVSRGLLAPAVRRTPLAGPDGRHDLAAVLAVLAESGHPVATMMVSRSASLSPVDSRRELAEAAAALRRRINGNWLDRGVSMVDPERTYIDSTVRLGSDITLFPGTILQGDTIIGDGCEIGPDTRLDRCTVGDRTVIEKTMARQAEVGDDAKVGPFAVLEPGSQVENGAVTGPFYAATADN